VYLHRGENDAFVKAVFQKKVSLWGELLFFPNGFDGRLLNSDVVWEDKTQDIFYLGYPRSSDRVKRLEKYLTGAGVVFVGDGWEKTSFKGTSFPTPHQKDVPGLHRAVKASPLVGDAFYAEAGWHCFRYYETIMLGCLCYVADDYYHAESFAGNPECIFSSGKELMDKVAALTSKKFQELHQAQMQAIAGNEWSLLGQRLMEYCNGLA
jgi:hypothetical protein